MSKKSKYDSEEGYHDSELEDPRLESPFTKDSFENWRKDFFGKDSVDAKPGRPTKFTEKAKADYFHFLFETGHAELAAQYAGVTWNCMRWHRDKDPDFAELEQYVKAMRSQCIQSHLEKQALEGGIRVRFNKDGDEVSRERVYETALRALVLKRHGENYQDKLLGLGDQDAPVGAVILPAGVPMEEWEKHFAGKLSTPEEAERADKESK